MTEPLILHLAPGSSSMAPHIALCEIGAPFEPRVVSLARKETHTADYLALNPAGQTPVLTIGGRPLTEVAGILFYLARRYPDAGLLPIGDIEAEAQVVAWMSFIASSVHPARRQGVAAAQAAFAVAERRLAGRPWAVGAYSIADIHLFRLFWRCANGMALDRAALPGLCAHYERMMARPAVRQTIAVESQIGYELP